jgi:ABC-type Mn2+/Zn2+ transport system permease subunit
MRLTSGHIYELAAAVMVAIAAGLVGSFALMKRMSLASDVVSHLALPGIGIALALRLNPALGAASTLLIGTLLVWGVEKKTGIATEAVIGVVFAASLAVGALITPREELEEVLFGSMQPLGLLEFIVGGFAAAGVITIVLLRRHHLALALFSPDIAAASGINLSGLSLEFLLLFSLTILLSLKFLGALLAGALLMIPAATGRRLATSLSSFLAYSAVAGAVAVIIGLAISSAFQGIGASGPAVVLVSAATFVFASFTRKQV